MYRFKLVVINLIVLAVLLITAEVAYFVYKNYLSNKEICIRKDTDYGYCPNFSKTIKLSEMDGGAEIPILVDQLGGRIDHLRPDTQLVQKAKMFFIGDSFIQADEVSYANTFYGILQESYDVYALGFSSWNPIQYTKAIAAIGRKEVTYNVFFNG